MGLLTILRKVKQRERQMRLLVLGLDNAGKTTIVRRLNGDDVRTVSPTLGFSIVPMQFRDYSLNLWDVGGQKTIRTYWRNYFEQTDGVIWVVDSADQKRMGDCVNELQVLLSEERLAGATLLVLANKQDLSGAMSCEEIEQILRLGDIGTARRHWRIEPCSALVGDSTDATPSGLQNGVEWLVEDIASRVFQYD